MIRCNTKDPVFHISTRNVSYIIGLHKGAYPVHLYWGKRVYGDDALWSLEAHYRRAKMLLSPKRGNETFTMEYLPMEYPSYGTCDFRPAADQVRD